MPKRCLAAFFFLSFFVLPACAQSYNVRDFGAKGDGTTLDTAALQKTIDQAGTTRGIVLIPAGTYFTGALNLRSNITIQLAQDAVLKGTQNVADFPIIDTRWEGNERKAYSCIINGRDLENVTITGKGLVDGNGSWWWQNRNTLPVPRPRLIEFINCKNVKLIGFSVKDSPGWNIHPIYCDGVLLDGLTINAPTTSPNTDGVDPDSSRNVTINNCSIDVGDDCIAIKSGKDADGLRVNKPTEYVTITNCKMFHGHGGVSIGSEMSGGVRHVRVADCVFDGTDNGVRLKTTRGRGGVIDDIVYENITMKNIANVIHMTMFYSGKTKMDVADPITEGTPTLGGVTMRNITATDCKSAGFFEGLPERPVSNVTLENVSISADTGLRSSWVKGLTFKNVTLKIKTGPIFTSKTNTEGTGLPE